MCGWQKRRNGWDIDKSMISFNLGVVPALSSMVYVFTEPGDKVLIQTPVYSEFYDVTESWGREVVESPLKEQDGRWIIDFEDFEEKAKEAKVFFPVSYTHLPDFNVVIDRLEKFLEPIFHAVIMEEEWFCIWDSSVQKWLPGSEKP